MDPWDMATSPASLCLLAAQLTVGTSSKLVAPPPPPFLPPTLDWGPCPGDPHGLGTA